MNGYPARYRRSSKKVTGLVSKRNALLELKKIPEDDEHLPTTFDLMAISANDSLFNAPYMRFGNVKPNWQEIYECISSPFANTFTQYLALKQKQREMEKKYKEGKSFMAQAVSAVFEELGKKGLNGLYSEEKILKMLKMATKMKTDNKYKAKVFCGPLTSKLQEFRTFIKHTKNALEKLKFIPKERVRDKEMDEVEAKLNYLEDKKLFGPKRKPLRTKRAQSASKSENKTSESMEKHAKGESIQEMRCKSCACTACGGLKYYHRIGKKMFVLPLVNDYFTPRPQSLSEETLICSLKTARSPVTASSRPSQNSLSPKPQAQMPKPSFLTAPNNLPKIKNSKELLKELNEKISSSFNVNIQPFKTHKTLASSIKRRQTGLSSLHFLTKGNTVNLSLTASKDAFANFGTYTVQSPKKDPIPTRSSLVSIIPNLTVTAENAPPVPSTPETEHSIKYDAKTFQKSRNLNFIGAKKTWLAHLRPMLDNGSSLTTQSMRFFPNRVNFGEESNKDMAKTTVMRMSNKYHKQQCVYLRKVPKPLLSPTKKCGVTKKLYK